ncbi:D-arabinono-1,4-lactone oxidase family protein [Mycobacterium ulcerans str. Harvey]|uniref:D-arabinono-1,4-lactone oxidase family protein n=1 Tax=Mycobacterium ulcerans str. Harvey TaxID=1299332 RepID=A0ABN0QLK9_MYCUL|nr:D-arabinono-1,4-lactone oxidase family protein [Mycobacterium ulcerans str. Harvey]
MEFGGRLYTAKDSRTTAETFHAMYPRIDEWIAVRRKVDPCGCSPPTWPDVWSCSKWCWTP